MSTADATASYRPITEVQGNTPAPWIGRSEWSLWRDCIGGWAQNVDKFREVGKVLAAYLRPRIVRVRLERLRELGHCEQVPTHAQLLVASRHQLSFSLGAETRLFYEAQGIPWTIHNLKRFVGYPTTMMDPVGLFGSRDSIIHHVLQTFHRHATYDLVLLCAHEGGVEEMQRQLDQLAEGTHLHQRALDALVEDGSYHDRLRRDVPEFMADPHVEPRPIPEGLVPDPLLMLAMDQFKDVRGYVNYAARLDVGRWDAFMTFVHLGINEFVGGIFGFTVGPKTMEVGACDPELVERHVVTSTEPGQAA